jgi:glycosyltransferase involved in cell wall biosynthesis
MIFPKFVITTIAGNRYADAAIILQLYMITGILRPAQNQAANLLNSTGRAKLVFYINTACLLFNFVVNYFFLVKVGFYGPVIGTVITCLLGTIWWYFVMKKEIRFESHNILWHSKDIISKFYAFMVNFFTKEKELKTQKQNEVNTHQNGSKRIKVAYIISTNPHDKTSWSGISYYLGQAVKKNVGPVDFIWPIKFPKLVMTLLVAFVKLNRILFNKEYKIQYSLVYGWFSARYINKYLKGKKYDCILAPVSPMYVAFLKTDIPIVYFTDVTFNQYSHYYKKEFTNVSPLSLWEGEWLERRTYKKSKLVIFTSKWAGESGMNFYGIPQSKIGYIPLGANMDFTPGKDIIFRKEKTPVLSLLFLGVDWDRKGGKIAYDTLIHLNEMGIKARLVICGCTPPDGISNPSMEVIPFLDKNRKEHHDMFFELLSTFHFLILPTRADCSSAVSCEANAYGMPSIATITGGVPEVILDGVNGYCLPYEAGGPEYAKLIAEVYHDKEKYHELIRTSRQRYEDHLNWEKWTEQFKVLYQQHIAKENEPAVLLKPELC